MTSPVPHGSEFGRAHLKSGLFSYLPGNGLGRALVHIHPPSRQRPAVFVHCLPDEQYLAIAEHRSTDAQLRAWRIGFAA